MSEFGGDSGDDGLQIGESHRQWRHEDDHIAERAEHDAAVAKLLADFGAHATLGVEAGEFDADHKAFLADFADVFERTKRVQHFCKFDGLVLHFGDEITFREEIERGEEDSNPPMTVKPGSIRPFARPLPDRAVCTISRTRSQGSGVRSQKSLIRP